METIWALCCEYWQVNSSFKITMMLAFGIRYLCGWYTLKCHSIINHVLCMLFWSGRSLYLLYAKHVKMLLTQILDRAQVFAGWLTEYITDWHNHLLITVLTQLGSSASCVSYPDALPSHNTNLIWSLH